MGMTVAGATGSIIAICYCADPLHFQEGSAFCASPWKVQIMSFRDFSKTHPETVKNIPIQPLDGVTRDAPGSLPDKSAAEHAPMPAPHQGAND